MVVEVLDGDGPKRVEADVERDPLDVEPRKNLVREVQTGRRCGRGSGCTRVHGLVPRGIGEGLGDVGRQGSLPGGLAVEPQAPASLPEVLEQLDGAVTLSRP